MNPSSDPVRRHIFRVEETRAIPAKSKLQDRSESFGGCGCARDLQKEDRILGEVVGKALELLPHMAHDRFEHAYIIHIQLLIHHLLPLGVFDGESKYASHSSQGFFDCH